MITATISNYTFYNQVSFFSNQRFYRTSPKAHLVLSSELKEIITGSMLGDLSSERKSIKSNARLQFKQSIKNEVYINHLWSLFKEYCGSKPLTMSYFDKRVNKMKDYSSIKFQTLSLPCFNEFREMFYNHDGLKIIPLNLKELLTERGLAYWIMDDGYKSEKGFYLCTESFSLSEIIFLIDILKSKLGLECNYHSHTNGYRLYIFGSSKDKLINLIKLYLLSHFYYKFDLI